MALSTAKLRAIAKKAMSTAGDVLTSVTYSNVSADNYDTSTGVVSQTKTDYTVSVLLCRLSDAEQDWFPAELIVQKMIVPYLDLPITPLPDDYVTISGVVWQITKVRGIPSQAIHIFYLRQP